MKRFSVTAISGGVGSLLTTCRTRTRALTIIQQQHQQIKHCLPWCHSRTKSDSTFTTTLPSKTTILKTPLNEPLPGFVEQEGNATIFDSQQFMKTRMTTLDSGLKIITAAAPGSTAVIGATVGFGSRDTMKLEGLPNIFKSSSIGAPLYFERSIFRETQSQNADEMTERLKKIGDNVQSRASRESIIHVGTVELKDIPEWISILSDSVINPKFNNKFIKADNQSIVYSIQDAISQAEFVTELLQNTAYSNKNIGTEVHDLSGKSDVDAKLMQKLQQEYYTASNMVISGSGVDHDFLVNICKHYFKDLPTHSRPEKVPAEYTGGHFHLDGECDDPTSMTHVGIAYPGGSWENEQDVYTMAVLQFLLGGGSSFSAGGPGKGMFSRLYLDVLNTHGFVDMCNAAGIQFGDASLFTLYGSCESVNAKKLMGIMHMEFERLGSDKIGDMELQRAKNRLKSTMMSNLEMKALLVEELGRQMVSVDKMFVFEDTCKGIDSVTEKHIVEMIQKMLAQPVTTCIVGKFPGSEDLQGIF